MGEPGISRSSKNDYDLSKTLKRVSKEPAFSIPLTERYQRSSPVAATSHKRVDKSEEREFVSLVRSVKRTTLPNTQQILNEDLTAKAKDNNRMVKILHK